MVTALVARTAAALLLLLAASSSRVHAAAFLPHEGQAQKRQALGNATCSDIQYRVPWGNLTSQEKSDYIEAELCIINGASKAGFDGAVTRWDDLQYSHVSQTVTVHNVGAFLPFHRYYMTVHERLMRQECNYTGRMAYWDEANDLPYMNTSGIFETEYFGGDGNPDAGYCLTDGPFANLTLRWNNQTGVQEHCLGRDFDLDYFALANRTYIDECFEITNYTSAWQCLAQNPHSAGHFGVGVIMEDATLSPGDPTFWLHHTYLDKVWWEWQQLDWPARKYDMGGPNIPTFASEGLSPKPEYYNYFNDGGGNVTTLNHTLFIDGLSDIAPNVTIGDVMDIRGEVICADYL